MVGRYVALALLLTAGCVPTTGSGSDDDDPAEGDVPETDGGSMDGGSTDGGPSPDGGPAPDGDPPPDGDTPPADADPGRPDAAPVDGGPEGRPEECNMTDDDLDGRIDEGEVCPPGPPTPIAGPAEVLELLGTLDETSPGWQRPDADCSEGPMDGVFPYAAWRIVNPTDEAFTLDLLANWGETDGYLFVFADPFAPDDLDGCLAGNDDFEGTGGSRIEAHPIAPGEVLTVVATTFSAMDTAPAFSVRVLTVPGPERRCADGLDDDVDGDVDCDDSDCADTAECDPCFAVECRPGAQCEEGQCIDFALPVPAVGETLTLDGALPPGTPTYDRPTEACRPTGETVVYTTVPIVNRTGAARMLRFDARWFEDDGVVTVFRHPFDPARDEGCVGASDRVDRQPDQDRIGALRIEPDEVLVVVPSAGYDEEFVGRFEVDLITLDDDPGVELVCDDEVDDDRDGSPSCADWDCVEAPVCEPCQGIVCADDQRCVDGVCDPVDRPDAIEVGHAGETVVIVGDIDADDPQWARPTDTCVAQEAGGMHYEAIRLRTPEGFAVNVTITAEWPGGDGFLHVFSDPFDPDDLESCLAGSDDDGTTERSRIDDFALARDQSIVVVASTYGVGEAIPRYILRITSEP